jgi:hypothetical protein
MNLLRRHLQSELYRLVNTTADTMTRHVVMVGSTDGIAFPHSAIPTQNFGFASAQDLHHELTSDASKLARVVILLGALNRVDDIYTALHGVSETWKPNTRLVSISYNRIWWPIIRLMRTFTGAQPNQENWIPPKEIENLLGQADFEIVERRSALLLPISVPILGTLVNRWLSPLPILRHLCVYNIVIGRPRFRQDKTEPSVSVIVAARNEEGNVDALVRRLPRLAKRQELIFVEGGSHDDTWGAIQRMIGVVNPSGSVISAYKQTGVGKGDAIRLGFARATGDILVILDGDLSVPPEELPRFIHLLRTNHCEFANGSRLVYPMEKQAMQFLNLIGNRMFGVAFSFLLGQPIRDTLCGTKVLWSDDYRRIAGQRSYFGDFDPFGDFDLLFGAARLNLKIHDVPVHYKERVYGSTNISRFRHGLLLLHMTAIAAKKLRFI